MKLLGGHTALDFVNTVGGRTHTTAVLYDVERDHLQKVDDLYAWAVEAKLISAAGRRRLIESVHARPRMATATLHRALALRESLYRIFKAILDERKPDAADLQLLNREVAEARAHERLVPDAGRLAVRWDTRDTLDHPLHIVARAAAELLTSEQLSRVRLCGGESCGWLFLDATRNRSRQWCDMRDCGNVAKVRRFRERQKAVS